MAEKRHHTHIIAVGIEACRLLARVRNHVGNQTLVLVARLLFKSLAFSSRVGSLNQEVAESVYSYETKQTESSSRVRKYKVGGPAKELEKPARQVKVESPAGAEKLAHDIRHN